MLTYRFMDDLTLTVALLSSTDVLCLVVVRQSCSFVLIIIRRSQIEIDVRYTRPPNEIRRIVLRSSGKQNMDSNSKASW